MLSQERSLFENTVGIIFLGTPHRGIEDVRPNWWVGMKIDALRWSLDWYEEYKIVREIQANRSKEGEAGGLLSVSSAFVKFYNDTGSQQAGDLSLLRREKNSNDEADRRECQGIYPLSCWYGFPLTKRRGGLSLKPTAAWTLVIPICWRRIILSSISSLDPPIRAFEGSPTKPMPCTKRLWADSP